MQSSRLTEEIPILPSRKRSSSSISTYTSSITTATGWNDEEIRVTSTKSMQNAVFSLHEDKNTVKISTSAAIGFFLQSGNHLTKRAHSLKLRPRTHSLGHDAPFLSSSAIGTLHKVDVSPTRPNRRSSLPTSTTVSIFPTMSSIEPRMARATTCSDTLLNAIAKGQSRAMLDSLCQPPGTLLGVAAPPKCPKRRGRRPNEINK